MAGSGVQLSTRVSGGGAIISVEIKNLDKFMKKFSPITFMKIFNQKMNIRLRSFAYKAMRRIFDTIYSGKIAKNKNVQYMIKGHNTALIDTRDLVDHGIGWKFIKSTAGASIGLRIGAKDGVHAPSGMTYKRFVEYISKEQTFTPKQAQRNFLKNRLFAAAGETTKGYQPTWTIPARPFLSEALMKPAVANDFKRTVSAALNDTVRILNRG